MNRNVVEKLETRVNSDWEKSCVYQKYAVKDNRDREGFHVASITAKEAFITHTSCEAFPLLNQEKATMYTEFS